MKFGEIVKKHRKERNLSAAQLAQEIGVSQGLISHIETGKREPSKDVINKISEVLNIPLDEFEDENEEVGNKRKIITGAVLKSRIGVTDIEFDITTNISKDIDFDNLTEEEQKKIKGKYGFETSIIVNSIADFLELKEAEMKNIIINNLNKELEKMRNEYRLNE